MAEALEFIDKSVENILAKESKLMLVTGFSP